ncbi:MAG: hypothetical protein J6X74_03655, partial [Bacteroidaceae bacterium]|nr:hypothetical protein [Bacteroidaceae bacterium]
MRRELIDTYWESLQDYITVPDCPPCYRELTRSSFDQRLRLFVFFRILQVLGAYGFRGLWEKKKHFIDSIPPALENLRSALLQGSADDYPYLKEVLEQLVNGQWSMFNGQWSMVNGQCSMVNNS